MSPIEGIILFAVVIILVRNFRKDRSDGRDPLGGGGGGGGKGGGSGRETQLK